MYKPFDMCIVSHVIYSIKWVYNNKLYAIGGFNGNERLQSVECLDLLKSNPKWTASAPLLRPRSNFGVTIVDKKIFVVGGFDGEGVVSHTELYDDESKTWNHSEPLNVKRSALSVVTVTGLANKKDFV